MNLKCRVLHRARVLLAMCCAVAIVPGDTFALARCGVQADSQTSSSTADVSPIPPDQLDSLVAPIALYPDPLLAQTLAASTYPLELLQLHQWLQKNHGLKDQALVAAVEKQPWDPSVQAMAALPDVVKWLSEDIQWTTDLGNAFLAQQNDVMAAVQRMRRKAQDNGSLMSTPQQTVQTEVVESKQVIVIEQANPEVVYVPSYNPTVVYGAPVYPYPPIYYPPPGYYAAGAAISFGVGVAMGAAWGGGWGWNAGWGHNDITVNRNNNFNRNTNINNVRGSNTWQHNSAHRGGAPYRDRATANRYGGAARGDSLANRQAGARQQLSRQGGNLGSGAVGTSGRTGDLGNRAGSGNLGSRAGAGNGDLGSRAGAGGGNFGNRAGGGNLGERPGGGNIGNRPTQLPSGGDRIGSRDLSRPSGGSGAFGSGSYSGSGARASSSRGSSSLGSSGANRGGGFSGGGGRSRPSGGGGGRSRGGGGGGRR
jgi:hypothetical protein